MKAFAALYAALDASTSSLAKQAAIQRYLQAAPARDAAWAVYFLAGGKPRQLVPTQLLRAVAREVAGLPQWLFDECHDAVGDLAETISLLLPPPSTPLALGLADWVETRLLPLRELRRNTPQAMADTLRAQWDALAPDERFVYFKLITGAFRVGVSKLLVTKALAATSGVDAKRIAQRLVGTTRIGARPAAADYEALIASETVADGSPQTSGQPYPFFLAHPLAKPPGMFDSFLGPIADWLVEWKWDGIRAQLVKRAGQAWLWSRGEELITEHFPELEQLGLTLPNGSVIDGEVIIWRDERVQSFAELQRRIGRKTPGPRLLRELPALLMAYDLLEEDGADLRHLPGAQRRERLDALVARWDHPSLRASPLLHGVDWGALARLRDTSREHGVEGMMLKQRNARYGVGRTKDVGVWWKWKIDPLSVDAVLTYAQRGHGRRAGLYSDYTFAVWDAPPEVAERRLVTFAKAYSGLTDAEMARVDAIIRNTTIESFGPVKAVRPTLVFELGFEGIARSPRHKSGIAVRFPRMLRWRTDKPVEQADTLQSLQTLLPR